MAEDDVLAQQVQLCVESLLHIKELCISSPGPAAVQARKDVISALFSLHIMRNDDRLIKGSVCMAPRFIDGTYDVAIVLEVDEVMAVIVWVYPRNRYELLSNGIRIDTTLLRVYTIEDYSALQSRVLEVCVGDRILSCSKSGYYTSCTVKHITSDTLDVQHDDGYHTSCSRNVMEVVPLLHSSSQQRGVLVDNEVVCDASNGSDSNSCSSDDDDYSSESDVRTLPSHSIPITSLPNAGYGLGEWERHTKGIGGKLLRRMGYTIGRGLGKEQQGRSEPLPAMRVLPAGLALDYIKEVATSKSDEEQGRKRPRRKRNKQQPPSDTPKTVFDFLNSSFAEEASGKNSSSMELLKDIFDVPVLPKSTAGRSHHSVNVAHGNSIVSLNDEERKLEAKLCKFQEAYQRNAVKEAQIKANIGIVERDLAAVRSAKKSVSVQISRKVSSSNQKLKKIF